MTIADSHCHLSDRQFDEDREAVIGRAVEVGVTTMLTIVPAADAREAEAGLRLTERYDAVVAGAGVHPHEASRADAEALRRLAELVRHPRVVALGEIGLDYHYDFSPRDVQRRVFAAQLEIAGEAGLPVVIHTREAWQDTVEILRRYRAADSYGGIMHCFSGGPDQAREAVAMGFHVSFAGVLTFPKAEGVRAAARAVPAARLLVETDCPYLAPVPRRGKRNEPAWIFHTAARLADVRGESPEEIARITTGNFERLCLRSGKATTTLGPTHGL